MKTRNFGRTGVLVSEIGHGTWTMGSFWGPRDDKAALQSLEKSLSLGVNFIDTAYVYGEGHSERLIGQTLKKTGKRPFIATKVPPKNNQWPARHTAPVSQAFPADHIVDFTNRSLKNLGLDCLDLQQLHVWSDTWLSQGDWLSAIEKLKKEGKIKYFGVSINDHEPDSALKIVESGLIDSVQVIYNIFDQTPEEKLFPACLKHNVAVIARVPFDEGSLTGILTPETKFPKSDWRRHYFTPERLVETCARVEKLKTFLDDEIKTLPELALRYILAHPAVSTVIPGMRTTAHVETNCQASKNNPLSVEKIAELKKHAWPRNFYPSWG